MATLTRGELTAQEQLSHDMGLHSEKLSGRSQQVFFDFDLSEDPARLLACRMPTMSTTTSGPRSTPPTCRRTP